jgi:radical SAM superfamily enzyme YgiQ (UPF0313 family)
MESCKRENVAISIPSMRIDSFSLNILKEIQGYKKTGLTFAPEAGSQRLRDVINKNITDDEILNAVGEAAGLGWNHVKFYFMVGLPTETADDLDAIASIARRSMERARAAQGKGFKSFSLTVSVSNFVPKAHTPFQWAGQDPPDALLEKNMYLKGKMAKIKGVKFQYHDPKSSHVEALLARGDRRALKAIERAVALGCKFDSWNEFFRYDLWMQAFAEAGAPSGAGGFGLSAALPWDHLSCGVDKAYLAAEWQRAERGALTPDCRAACTGCGLECRKNNRVGDYEISGQI